ncbi:hypothetical protein [Colwellia sp. C1TZA3]|uniref:hypothetical protein n=1 Tax=Colwellia sp. C1TZA3 TaxID=2508879 RepID=UPI0011B9E361|nr:hypothetical protein [Colwellia sp. C1TZA3]TWX72211.1 hypothetical protein ESZ39_08945 [Colwellia sp. C1TZA3]
MTKILFTSQEFKELLDVSDCELMHMRSSGKLAFVKKGNAFLYQLHDKKLLLNHPIANNLLNWYREKHQITIDNSPKEIESINSILILITSILLPVSRKFGNVRITYGFVSPKLNRYIQKNSSSGTFPPIDQHAASELTQYNKLICKRNGLACDFVVNGYEKKMDQVMLFIVKNLNFDKIYYYGNDKPLHVSIGNKSERHLQAMNLSDKGRRIPGRKAYGDEAKILAEELIK